VLTVDYAVWGALQQTVYHHQSVSSVVELKTKKSNCQSMAETQSFIDKSVGQWRRRLECAVRVTFCTLTVIR